MSFSEFSAVVVLLGTVAAIVLLIAWIVLPFALIGVKPLLRQMIAQLSGLREDLARQQGQQRDRDSR